MVDEFDTPELDDGSDDEEGPAIEFYGGKWMSALPILLFIAWAVVQSALFRIGNAGGLVAGMLLSLIVGMLFVKGDWKSYANTIFEGMTQRVAATAIVAWLWAGMFSATMQAGGFVEGLVWAADAAGVGAALFPAATFVLAGLLATGIGTGYGTTVAFTTLFFPAGVLLGASPVLMFGAILSGAVFGDNLAPVSDTTIVSAVTQEADIGGVVSSRFKYAIVAAVLAFAGYVVAGGAMPGIEIGGNAGEILVENSDPLGLIHLVSMGIVIATAVKGRHIVEAISWGIVAAVVFNVALGLAAVSEMLVFQVPGDAPLAGASVLPFVELVESGEAAVGGSIYDGAAGFFPLSILVLLIVAAAYIMIRGGAFEALLDWSMNSLARSVRSAELTMVGSTALINTMITINTAAEIAIGPYIKNVGDRFNVNGYRRANILDANTAAMGYIFPWSGGVLVGFAAMQTQVVTQFEWFTQAMVVNPVDVIPFVFQGWLLFAVFVASAWTGFGREYTTDRRTEEVSRV
ncbi:Na+/H+ antiporter NhaC family protein [Halomicrobium urmianum]|uniref:Na+/H+ antiporter NhaC family protein n=1 Tax=Halomicrobium urmianum TaxID=1586233 RepID=UPI001CDA4045|nr:Na+/H+ antiporter NhaC family protein [Halomicrobium urmianum]